MGQGMTSAEQCAVPASMARWPDAAEFIQDFCTRHGVARTQGLRLTLVAEELFTNVVEHGRAAGADAPPRIRLELALAHGALELLFEDTAQAFDPLAHAREQPAVLDAPAEARPVGGLGLHLVASLADSACYAREDGCNRLRLRLALAPADDQPGS